MANGFKNMSRKRHQEIARRGGKSTSAKGHNKNQWTPAQAREFGKIGAVASVIRRELAKG
jgi:general stress protein YciG